MQHDLTSKMPGNTRVKIQLYSAHWQCNYRKDWENDLWRKKYRPWFSLVTGRLCLRWRGMWKLLSTAVKSGLNQWLKCWLLQRRSENNFLHLSRPIPRDCFACEAEQDSVAFSAMTFHAFISAPGKLLFRNEVKWLITAINRHEIAAADVFIKTSEISLRLTYAYAIFRMIRQSFFRHWIRC